MGRKLGPLFRLSGDYSKVTQTEWAYLAAIIDGEGSLTTKRANGKDYYINISICNTHRGLIDWIYRTFPGGYIQVRLPGENLNRAITYHWRCGRQNCVRSVLRGVLPYLIVKRPQAELMLRYKPSDSLRRAIMNLNQRRKGTPWDG